MKKELIGQLHNNFESVAQREGDVEYWYARDLQNLLGYNEWRNFLQVINKAKQACVNSGHPITDHFVDVNKMVSLGSGSQRKVDDIKRGFNLFEALNQLPYNVIVLIIYSQIFIGKIL